MRRLLPFLFLLVIHSSGAAAEDLVVQVNPGQPIKLTLSDLELLPHQTLQAKDHNGISAAWSGVPLYQVLQQAGVSFGDTLRGAALAQYVVISAPDGYRVVFALPELDPRNTDHPVLLCDSMNGAPLPADIGPLRIVTNTDKRHFRWVRHVTRIELRKVE